MLDDIPGCNTESKSVFDVHRVDEKVRLFMATLVRHLDKTLPERTVRMYPTDKPWMTPRIKKSLRPVNTLTQLVILMNISNYAIRCLGLYRRRKRAAI